MNISKVEQILYALSKLQFPIMRPLWYHKPYLCCTVHLYSFHFMEKFFNSKEYSLCIEACLTENSPFGQLLCGIFTPRTPSFFFTWFFQKVHKDLRKTVALELVAKDATSEILIYKQQCYKLRAYPIYSRLKDKIEKFNKQKTTLWMSNYRAINLIFDFLGKKTEERLHWSWSLKIWFVCFNWLSKNKQNCTVERIILAGFQRCPFWHCVIFFRVRASGISLSHKKLWDQLIYFSTDL